LLLLVAPATKQHSSFFYYIKCSKQYHIVLWLTHYYYCFPLPHQDRRTQKRDRNSFDHTNELPGPYTYTILYTK
jgi:hypothetical protein